MSPEPNFPSRPGPPPKRDGWFWWRAFPSAHPDRLKVIEGGHWVAVAGGKPMSMDQIQGEWGDEAPAPEGGIQPRRSR
jgi:hypothetical protein